MVTFRGYLESLEDKVVEVESVGAGKDTGPLLEVFEEFITGASAGPTETPQYAIRTRMRLIAGVFGSDPANDAGA